MAEATAFHAPRRLRVFGRRRRHACGVQTWCLFPREPAMDGVHASQLERAFRQLFLQFPLSLDRHFGTEQVKCFQFFQLGNLL